MARPRAATGMSMPRGPASSRPRILGDFQQTSWAPAPKPGEAPRQPQVRVDLGARMRGMWK